MSFWAKKEDETVKVFDTLPIETQERVLTHVALVCAGFRGIYESFTEAERTTIGLELERVGMKLVNKAVFAFTTGAEPADIVEKLKEATKGSAFFAAAFEIIRHEFTK